MALDIMKKVIVVCAVIVLAVSDTLSAETTPTVEVRISTDEIKWQISKYLLGMHFVYAHEKDSIYADGRIARWAKRVNVGVARFPGGTVVKYWNWDNSTGVFAGDRHDPKYDPSQDAPASKWMSLDEYLAFCQQSGAEPMVGVNIWSGHVLNRTDEGIKDAIECMKYTRRKGFPVRWWYLGNEEHLTIQELAGLVNQYAPAMKAIDPDIKIIVNRNKINPSSLTQLLQLAGDNFDMIEFHGKWKGFKTPGTLEMWEKERPLVVGDRGYAYSEHIDRLRRAARQAGFPNLMFANNEWGLGQKLQGFDKFMASLVMVEYLQDLCLGNYDMACLWNTQWPRVRDKHLLDSTDGYKLNPIAQGFELLSTALGQSMVKSSTTDPLVYGFACRDEQGEQIQLFLLNKYNEPRDIVVSIDPFDQPLKATSSVLQSPGDRLHDQPVTFDDDTDQFQVTLPPHSYSRIRFLGE